jgi:hypothetical protein
LESLSGVQPVIPWKSDVAATLTRDFGEERAWIQREGIAVLTGEFGFSSYLRVPNAHNIFASLAESLGYKLSISPAGRTCEQIISAVGGLKMLGIVARSPELLRFLDRLAHDDLEVEIETGNGGESRRRVRKAFAPLSAVQEVIQRSNEQSTFAARHLNALIRCNVLKLGMALPCSHCQHTSWFSLEDLAPKLSCPRCLGQFDFPSGSPPPRDAWAYKVIGPFAAGHFAHGAYCVAAALHFLSEKVSEKANWIPSFTMQKNTAAEGFESDFGMLVPPGRTTHRATPHLIFGECKSFNRFDNSDFARARATAKLFPGAVLCFCTFNDSLDQEEIRGLTRIAIEGRRRKDVGQQMNPVLILTARELFSEFRHTDFNAQYGDKAQYVRAMFMRNNMEELCDFTQQTYLGMPSYHQWREEKHKIILKRRAARAGV